MNIDIVDSINEKINLFNDTYGTEIVAVFPEREEVYVRDMGQFLKAYFEDFDDEAAGSIVYEAFLLHGLRPTDWRVQNGSRLSVDGLVRRARSKCA